MNADFAKPIHGNVFSANGEFQGTVSGHLVGKLHARATEPGARARVSLNLGLQGSVIDGALPVTTRYPAVVSGALAVRNGDTMQLGVGELQMPSLRQRKESIARRGVETARRAAQLLGMQLPLPGAKQEDSSILLSPQSQTELPPTERLQVVNGSNGGAIRYRQKLLDALGEPETPAHTLLLIRKVLAAADQCAQWANCYCADEQSCEESVKEEAFDLHKQQQERYPDSHDQWRLPDLSAFQPWAIVSMVSSPSTLSQLQTMKDQAMDPSMNRTLGRLLGSLSRLSCTGDEPLASSCHQMGCRRSYPTLITRDAPDVTDLPFLSRDTAHVHASHVEHAWEPTLPSSKRPATRYAWASTSPSTLPKWDVGMAQQLALLQAEETSQTPTEHRRSPSAFDAQEFVAPAAVSGIIVGSLPSSPPPLQPAVPPHVAPPISLPLSPSAGPPPGTHPSLPMSPPPTCNGRGICCCPSDSALVKYAPPGKAVRECCMWKRGLPRKGLATCVDDPDRHTFGYEWMDTAPDTGLRCPPSAKLVPGAMHGSLACSFSIPNGLRYHRRLNCSRTGYEWRHGLARHTMTQDRWMASTKLQVGWCCDPNSPLASPQPPNPPSVPSSLPPSPPPPPLPPPTSPPQKLWPLSSLPTKSPPLWPMPFMPDPPSAPMATPPAASSSTSEADECAYILDKPATGLRCETPGVLAETLTFVSKLPQPRYLAFPKLSRGGNNGEQLDRGDSEVRTWLRDNVMEIAEHMHVLRDACAASGPSSDDCAASVGMNLVMHCANRETPAGCIESRAAIIRRDDPWLLGNEGSKPDARSIARQVNSGDTKQALRRVLQAGSQTQILIPAIEELLVCVAQWCRTNHECDPGVELIQKNSTLTSTISAEQAKLAGCTQDAFAVDILSKLPQASCDSLRTEEDKKFEKEKRTWALQVVKDHELNCVRADCSAAQVLTAASNFHSTVREIKELCVPLGGSEQCALDEKRRLARFAAARGTNLLQPGIDGAAVMLQEAPIGPSGSDGSLWGRVLQHADFAQRMENIDLTSHDHERPQGTAETTSQAVASGARGSEDGGQLMSVRSTGWSLLPEEEFSQVRSFLGGYEPASTLLARDKISSTPERRAASTVEPASSSVHNASKIQLLKFGQVIDSGESLPSASDWRWLWPGELVARLAEQSDNFQASEAEMYQEMATDVAHTVLVQKLANEQAVAVLALSKSLNVHLSLMQAKCNAVMQGLAMLNSLQGPSGLPSLLSAMPADHVGRVIRHEYAPALSREALNSGLSALQCATSRLIEAVDDVRVLGSMPCSCLPPAGNTDAGPDPSAEDDSCLNGALLAFNYRATQLDELLPGWCSCGHGGAPCSAILLTSQPTVPLRSKMGNHTLMMLGMASDCTIQTHNPDGTPLKGCQLADQLRNLLNANTRTMLNSAMMHAAMRAAAAKGNPGCPDELTMDAIQDLLAASTRIVERACPDDIRSPPPSPPKDGSGRSTDGSRPIGGGPGGPGPSMDGKDGPSRKKHGKNDGSKANNGGMPQAPPCDKPPCNQGCCPVEMGGKQQFCYGHGECENCHCFCADGWKGRCCDEPVPVCPVAGGKVCAGHGVCTPEGSCVCDKRWGGSDCFDRVEICPDDFECVHGVCNAHGRCDCDRGYAGDDCALGPFLGAAEDCEKPSKTKAKIAACMSLYADRLSGPFGGGLPSSSGSGSAAARSDKWDERLQNAAFFAS